MSRSTPMPPAVIPARSHRLSLSPVRAVLLGLLLVLSVPLAAHAEDVTLSIAPGEVTEDSARGETFSWILDPGATLHDSVLVTNYNDVSLQLDLGAKDAVTTSDGNLDLALADEVDTGIGSWITLDQESLDIPAGQSASVPFTLTVPEDASPGDYSGGVVVTYSTQGTTVSVDNRVATRVDVRVAGETTVSHEISDLAVDMPSTWSPLSPTTATVHYTLTNTGTTRLYAQEAITASGPLGIGALRTDTTLAEVLPGASVERTATVDARALLWNRVAVSTTSFSVDEKSGGTQELSASVFAAPWTQLIIAAVVLALAVVAGVALSTRAGRRAATR